MKTWGLSRWGALLAVFLLLVSGAVLPLNAHAQGKKVWGVVTECATGAPVGAQVSLVDVHGRLSDLTTTAAGGTGFFTFQPTPGYYKLKASPTGFTHFTVESSPIRFDGTVNVRQDLCADKMPDKNRWLNLTVLDAQPNAVTGEAVSFQESARGPENATEPGRVRFARTTGIVTLDTKPLKWGSESILYKDDVNPLGITLAYGSEYTYGAAQAFNGQIQVTDPTVWGKLNNTLTGGTPRGFLTVAYTNVSQSSSLPHGQVSTVTFYKNGVPMPDYTPTLEFSAATGAIRIVGNWTFQTDALTADYAWSGAIEGATVTVRDPARDQPIAAPLTTNAAGNAFARVWDAALEVKVEAESYQPRLVPYTISGDRAETVFVSKGWTVRVLAVDEDIDPVLASDGLTGVMINLGAVNKEIRVLQGVAQDNQVTFHAYDGSWLLVVDANGFAAHTETVLVAGANLPLSVVELKRSPEERTETTVMFLGGDWNDVAVYRNLTLRGDSAFPGIPFGHLRNVRWQLDMVFGNADGVLTPLEEDAVAAYLRSAGPFHTATDSFLTVNGKAYRSKAAPADFTVAFTDGPGTNVTVSTRANYTLSDPSKPIALNQAKYYVNVTTIADRNVTVYQNRTVFVLLPAKYEMTSKTVVGNVTTRGFTRVEVDPGVDTVVPNPRANTVVEYSLTGVARAEVEGPIGKVSVRESNQDKYLAWVANSTAIAFSANQTSDRQNQAVNAKDANFTWRFTENATGTVMGNRSGIWTTFDFGNVSGEYLVNLTVRQVNPSNMTWRQIRVHVDNVSPTANLKTNRTGATVNPTELAVDEKLETRFDARDSTDKLDATLEGKIAQHNWDFDGDGTVDRVGSIATWNYSKPGRFNLTLFVVDSVGHRSANRTLVVTAKDVTPPAVDFVILDPENEWRETSQLVEGKTYVFNASRTTDNSLNSSLDNVNLTYRWEWGDLTAANESMGMAGLNVTHTYARFGSNYKLNVSAVDAVGNRGYLNRTLVVQANTTAHPDLSIVAGTVTVSPTSPEEGQQVTFTFNVTNAKGKATARDLRVQFAIVERGTDKNQTNMQVAYLRNGTRVQNPTLAAEETITVEITWTVPEQVGNHSMKMKVWDADEPDPWITSSNQVTRSLIVKEAGWKFWALLGGFVFVVFGIPIIYYVVRKVRAGEWEMPGRRRAEEEEDEGEEEEEDEDRPRKKRL